VRPAGHRPPQLRDRRQRRRRARRRPTVHTISAAHPPGGHVLVNLDSTGFNCAPQRFNLEIPLGEEFFVLSGTYSWPFNRSGTPLFSA
jgi:hypothetical protein